MYEAINTRGSAPVAGRWERVRTAILLGAAALAASLTAQARAATVLNVDSASYSPAARWSGLAVQSLSFREGGEVGRWQVNLSGPGGATLSTYSFCIDVLHGIGVTDPFQVTSLSAAFGSLAKQRQVVGLLSATRPLIDGAATPDLARDIAAATALAVWELVYEPGDAGYDVTTGNFSIYGDGLAYGSLANQYLGFAESGLWSGDPGRGRILASVNGLGQNQVFLAAVPEPATWTLMIGGVGAAGASLRRRRRQALAR